MDFIHTTENIQVYKIRSKSGSCGWADISIDEGDNSGTIQINSDYGSWSFYWGSCGESFKKFLIGLDIGYASGKFGEGNWFDKENTINHYKKEIISARKDEYISSEDAREMFNEIKELDDADSKDAFIYTMYHACEKLFSFFECSPEIFTDVSPSFLNFWNKTWKYFVSELKKEVSEKIAA